MTRHAGMHEDLTRRHAVKEATDRSFGLVLAAVFAAFGFLPLLSGEGVRPWALATGAAFLGVSLFRPALLAPLNRGWQAFGRALDRVVSPVVLAFLFYGVMTPVGLLLRAFGKDVLRLRFDERAQSYWIKRDPPGPPPETMRNQF